MKNLPTKRYIFYISIVIVFLNIFSSIQVYQNKKKKTLKNFNAYIFLFESKKKKKSTSFVVVSCYNTTENSTENF
jgi:uncharacterized protein with NRDE domain